MDKQKAYYAKDEKQGKKKIIVIIAMIVAAITLIGIIAAYYSDVASFSDDVTSSRLKINGTYTVLLNGDDTELGSITSLNPGDVIVIKGTISNVGNQSAWVREKIDFDTTDSILYDYLKVYSVELTQSELTPGNTVTDNLMPLSVDGSSVSGNRVLNGTGANAQTESGGGYTYINSDTYNFVITIYFMHTAPNATQGTTFTLSAVTQGLQFRNNNTSEPNEDAWSVVAAV